VAFVFHYHGICLAASGANGFYELSAFGPWVALTRDGQKPRIALV
jgi:hypothetical protein